MRIASQIHPQEAHAVYLTYHGLQLVSEDDSINEGRSEATVFFE